MSPACKLDAAISTARISQRRRLFQIPMGRRVRDFTALVIWARSARTGSSNSMAERTIRSRYADSGSSRARLRPAWFRIHKSNSAACSRTKPLKESIELVAYVVGANVDSASLRAHLQQHVPDHMVPSAFLFIEAMPLSSNGKIDRAKLPVADVEQQLSAMFVAPRNETEEALCRIWSKVLALPKIGVEDNFFELGGHSLLAIQVRSRIQSAFGVELPLRSLFDQPTIAQLALRVEIALIEELSALEEGEVASIAEEMRKAAAAQDPDALTETHGE